MMMKTVLVSAMVLVFVSTSWAYNYVGCYVDRKPRILEGKFTSAPNMTVEYCVQICSQEGDYFAGVEYSSQCFCGKKLESYPQLSESSCSTPCKGDSSQKCGGTWKISVYTTNFNYAYLGCYEDKSVRILEGDVISSNAMTTDMCIQKCHEQGKRFALTQFSSQCFCGNHLRSYPKKEESECDHACTGNQNEMCGGFWRGSLYLLNYYDM